MAGDFDVTVTMTGLDAVLSKLEGLKYDVAKKGGRFALRKAAQVIRDAARARAIALNDPDTPAVIAKNIAERWSNVYNKRTGDLMFRVGIQGGAFGKAAGDTLGVYGDKFTKATRKRGAINGDLPGGDTRHWAYLEFGTEKMAARPFLRPSFQANLQTATNVFISEYSKAIDRALKQSGG
jgi:HK97 gp10 family phage protein